MNEKQIISSALLKESYSVYTHSSGLRVLLYPMTQFSSTYALFGTYYGSSDEWLVKADGTRVRIPDGTAHFLEHKLFEDEDGDVSRHFAKIGAVSNAYTSFESTAYLFSTSSEVETAVEALVKFVQTPYFTNETIQKELGIIGQEIRMYEDDPNWRVFFNLIGNLYHHHPIKIDIAGTDDSIAAITPQMLYDCYETYYNPANMALVIVGNFDEEKICELLDRVLRTDLQAKPAEKPPIDEPDSIVRAYSEQTLSVSAPLFHIGFKEHPVSSEEELPTQLAYTILHELLVGKSSTLYQQMYEEKLINTAFDKYVFIGRGFLSSIFSGESAYADEIADRILAEVQRMRENGIEEDAFERARRALYGQAVMMFSEVDQVAGALLSAHFSNRSLYDTLSILSSMKKETLEQILDSAFSKERMSISMVVPVSHE